MTCPCVVPYVAALAGEVLVAALGAALALAAYAAYFGGR